jgi:hypothetical protein
MMLHRYPLPYLFLCQLPSLPPLALRWRDVCSSSLVEDMAAAAEDVDSFLNSLL